MTPHRRLGRTLSPLFLAAIGLILLAGCGDDPPPDDAPDDDASVADDGSASADCLGLTYRSFANQMFDQKCRTCHYVGTSSDAGDYDFSTLESIKRYSARILSHAVNGVEPVMPKAPLPPLDDATKGKLSSWIACGLPE